MKKEKLKLIVKYSFLLGVILGAISIVPYINIFSAIAMCVFASIIVIIYMTKRNEIGELTIKGAAILGLIIGFICLIGYLIVNLPVNAILGAIFSGSRYFALSRFLIEAWWLLIIMVGLIAAIFNSFALISYVYIKETYFMIEKNTPNFEPRNRNGI